MLRDSYCLMPLTQIQMQMQDTNTLLAWGVATSSVPFYVVENPILRQFCKVISSGNYQLPHWTALKDKVSLESKRVDANIKEKLSVRLLVISL